MKPKTPPPIAYLHMAIAKGWDIEQRVKTRSDAIWEPVTVLDTLSSKYYEIRVIPDEDGWLPWFGDGECPFDENVQLTVANITTTKILHEKIYVRSLNWKSEFAYRIYEEVEKKVEHPLMPLPKQLASYVLELAEAVDNADADIGGSRPQLDILRDAVKLADDILREAEGVSK